MSRLANPLTEAEMLGDLRATFPLLWTKPLRNFGAAYRQREGVWTGRCGTVMPDGLPIFATVAIPEPQYNGAIHEAFEEWLDIRGWYVETFDGETHHLLPARDAL